MIPYVCCDPHCETDRERQRADAAEARVKELERQLNEPIFRYDWMRLAQAREAEVARLTDEVRSVRQSSRIALNTLHSLEDRIDDLTAQRDSLVGALELGRACVAFFTSVIKSGEPWTLYCETSRDRFIAKSDTALASVSVSQDPPGGTWGHAGACDLLCGCPGPPGEKGGE